MKQLLVLLLAVLCLIGCAAGRGEGQPHPQRGEVIIALLDTGVSASAIQSEYLQSVGGWNYVTGTSDTEDRINHGTAVASVILGCESAGIAALAPDTPIIPLVIADKVEGAVTSVTPAVLAQAIRDSVDICRASVINISFGIKADDSAVREAIAYVQAQGALVICAVGNEGGNTDLYYPAAYDGVLAVGSHDKHLQVSDFTQKNGTAALLAPGEDIWLASRNGKTYGARGTSYAAGYVSAAAAQLMRANPALNAEDVMRILLDTADVVDGWRILNFDAARAHADAVGKASGT